MRVLGWSNSHGGIHHYRIREPLRGLSTLGHETKIIPAVNVAALQAYDALLVRGLHTEPNSLLWRWASAQDEHCLLVYDLDDDIWAWNPAYSPFRYWDDGRRLNAELNIQAADLVTTTNEALAKVLRELNENVAVLPNTIPQLLLRIASQVRTKFVIGWQGGDEHAQDLAVMYKPLSRFLLRHPDVEFHIWGGKDQFDLPEPIASRIRRIPWNNSVWNYYYSLSMDVGLAPLHSGDTFNETKSDIRLREYAALGIPFIASNVPAYRATGEAARGILVSDDEEWEEALEGLYRSIDYREWLSRQGRITAIDWTTERNAKERLVAYERAIYGNPRVRNPRESRAAGDNIATILDARNRL